MTDTIGGRIELALTENNMTRKELVEKSGINSGTLSKYIRNENTPNILKILKISKVLGVTAQWLSGFEQMDVCNKYKKDIYELYEICSHEFYAKKIKSEVVLIRQHDLAKYHKENSNCDNIKTGEKIKETLAFLNLMVKELAAKTGIHPNQITAYIHGRKNPSLSTVEMFAEALQVSPSWLAGFIDVDTRNTYVMQDNHGETIYIHPSQYVITKIEDDGNKITLKKIQKE